jgi:hypothetical protein
MDQNNKEVITFEVGNFVFDVSVKTPSYIQVGELNQLFKDEMILIIRKKLFELNQRFYVAHSITKKVDKLEQQKQNQLQNNLDTNMPNEQTTPPLYNRELIKNNDPIIKSENPIENAAINAYNSNSSIGQNTLQQSEPKQNVTQILNQIPNQQNIPPIIKENINNPIIKPNFSIKNFKVNEYKSLKIENDINDNLVISDIKIPDNLGISYNPTTMSIEGIPKIAGEYQITFLWASNEQHKTSGSIKLNIIDDPRNLWKNLPSDKNDKYFKEDVDSNFNSNRYYDIFVASKRGRSHAHVGSFRDDDFSIYTNQEKATYKYNIYLAKITRIEPSLQAAFVNYGKEKSGFLPFDQMHPVYYQIPEDDKKKLENEIIQKTNADENNADHQDDTDSEEQTIFYDILSKKYKIQDVIKKDQVA